MTQLAMLNSDATAPIERGRCHVHFGDWREQEPDWPRPFAYVSDVPYGQGYVSGWKVSRGGSPRPESLPDRIVGDGDTSARDEAMAVHGWDCAAIFGPKRLDRIPPWGDPKDILVWDGMAGGMGDLAHPWAPSHETVAIYGDRWSGFRGSDVLRYANPRSGDRAHPHQKPVALLTELVSKAPPGLPIVDPFMGSGPTAVACALLGREFWGAEIDPEYFDVIRGRLAAVGVNI